MLAALSLVAVATGAPVATSNLPEVHAQQLFTGLAKAHAQHLTKFGAPTPGQKYHDGLYVGECTNYHPGEEHSGDNRPQSSTSTYLFDESSNFKIDITYYTMDSSCAPNASDIFYKQFIVGRIVYKTVNYNPLLIGAAYQTTAGDYLLPSVMEIGTINLMNQYCGRACGTDWRQTGTMHHIKASDCHPASQPLPEEAPLFCRTIVGEKFYNGFHYANGYFQQNEGSFNELKGYNLPINQTNHIEWVQPSHNTDPDECTLIYSKCEQYMTDAASVCQTCDRIHPTDPDSKVYTDNYLECDGCVYRQAQDRSGRPDPSLFGTCCPCFYNQATALKAPFFAKLNC
jgi:hypothetical protein